MINTKELINDFKNWTKEEDIKEITLDIIDMYIISNEYNIRDNIDVDDIEETEYQMKEELVNYYILNSESWKVGTDKKVGTKN